MSGVSRSQSSALPQRSVQRSTPYEGFSAVQAPAPLGKRILAYVVDTAIVQLLMMLVMVAAGMGAGLFGLSVALLRPTGPLKQALSLFGVGAGLLLFLLVIIGMLAINSLYFVYQEYKTSSTIGKRMFGLHVVSLDGRPLTLSQCFLRDFMRLIDAMLVIPGVLAITLSEKKLRLGDMLAGTQLVYSRSSEKAQLYLYLSQEEYLALLATLTPRAPSPRTVTTFLRAQLQRSLGQALDPRLEEWCTAALRHHLPPAAQTLSPDKLYLFFAEYCRQTQASQPQGPRP